MHAQTVLYKKQYYTENNRSIVRLHVNIPECTILQLR